MEVSIQSGSTMLYVNLYLHDICYGNDLIVNGLEYYFVKYIVRGLKTAINRFV